MKGSFVAVASYRLPVASFQVIALLLLMTAMPALDAPHIDMHVDDAEVAVGDTLQVTVHYQWPAGWTVDPEPRPAAVFDAAGAFLTEVPTPTVVDDGMSQQRIWTLGVLAGRSGAWALPRPGMQATAPDGTVHTATAPEVIVQVGAGDDSARLPAPSQPWLREDGGRPSSPLWPWITVGVLLAIGSLLLLKRPKPAPPPTPAERFAQDLRLVQASTEGKHAASLLSQALRRYAGSIYGFDGVGATVRECRLLIRAHLDGEPRQDFLAILEGLEQVRWSPAELHAERVRELAIESERWVQAREIAAQAEASPAG